MSSLKILKSFRIATNSQSFLLPFTQSGYHISGKEVEVHGSGNPSILAPSVVSPPHSPVAPSHGPPARIQAKSLLLPESRGKKEHPKAA